MYRKFHATILYVLSWWHMIKGTPFHLYMFATETPHCKNGGGMKPPLGGLAPPPVESTSDGSIVVDSAHHNTNIQMVGSNATAPFAK